MKPSLIIAGLGNPGSQYDRTRHNAGFWAVDELHRTYGEADWKDAPKFAAVTAEARIVTVPVLLVKPQTYMNRSNEAIAKLIDFYKLDVTEQLLVCTDDIDLPLGELRLRRKGGPGTHNGLKSIVAQYGEEFTRIRIGIGSQPDGFDLANWVLSAPADDERKVVEEALTRLPVLVKDYVLGDATQR